MKGPYIRVRQEFYTVPNGSYRKFEETSQWYRTDNGKKTRDPLPRSLFSARLKPSPDDVDAPNSAAAYYTMNQWGRSSTFGNSMTAVNNKAYAKFLDLVRTSAGVGQNLAEYKQTIDLLHGTLSALRSPFKAFATAARRYAKQARFQPHELGRTALRDLGGAWLIWHFGVDPLIKDLYAICERLDERKNFEWRPVTASAQSSWLFDSTQKPGAFKWTNHEVYRGIVRTSAEVRLKDQMTAMMNDFGLINPASLAWEIVPFSFVVDWFYPVGAYLNSFSDLLGYETRNPNTTWYLTYFGRAMKTTQLWADGPWSEVQGCRIVRSLTGPTFKPPPFQLPERWSITRAATAIALLVQFLPKHQ